MGQEAAHRHRRFAFIYGKPVQIRSNVSWVLSERVSRQIYANALQLPREIPRGFVGVKPQLESLILAQNERWRQA